MIRHVHVLTPRHSRLFWDPREYIVMLQLVHSLDNPKMTRHIGTYPEFYRPTVGRINVLDHVLQPDRQAHERVPLNTLAHLAPKFFQSVRRSRSPA